VIKSVVESEPGFVHVIRAEHRNIDGAFLPLSVESAVRRVRSVQLVERSGSEENQQCKSHAVHVVLPGLRAGVSVAFTALLWEKSIEDIREPFPA
jgi:hypothetical protein